MSLTDLVAWVHEPALTLSPLGVFGAACWGGWTVWLWQRWRSRRTSDRPTRDD